MDTRILLVPYDSALRSVRMGAGPEHWMQRGLADHLRETGRNVETKVFESTTSFQAVTRTYGSERTKPENFNCCARNSVAPTTPA